MHLISLQLIRLRLVCISGRDEKIVQFVQIGVCRMKDGHDFVGDIELIQFEDIGQSIDNCTGNGKVANRPSAPARPG